MTKKILYVFIITMLFSMQVSATDLYRVKQEDTLFSISQKLNLSLNTILSLNPHIENPDTLFVHDLLVIPLMVWGTDALLER